MAAALAQVQSLTLGINVNSPYGITEPWVTIRDGLQRCEFVESISPQPNKTAATGELRPRHGQLPDLEMLAKALRDTGAGAFLRGVEASVEGEVSKEKNAFVLRPTGSTNILRLQPLTQLIQLGEVPTEMEKRAYETLASNWTGPMLHVKVVGPLRKGREQTAGVVPVGPLTLEVRRFLVLK